MDCGFFAVLLVVLGFAIWLIRYFIKEKMDTDETVKLGRERGYEFRVTLLYNQKKVWLNINDKEIRFFGNFFSINNLSQIPTDIKISYDQITSIIVNKNDNSGKPEFVNIRFNDNSVRRYVNFQVERMGDGNIIENSIAKQLKIIQQKKEMEIRKKEIEKLMRVRYRSGNFEGVSPDDFENIIMELFTFIGYSVVKLGHSGDQGIDLSCLDNSTGEKVIIQCKRYKGNVGSHIIRDFYGALTHSNAAKGYIVTTGSYTKDARQWAYGKPIELINGEKLTQLMMTYYK